MVLAGIWFYNLLKNLIPDKGFEDDRFVDDSHFNKNIWFNSV